MENVISGVPESSEFFWLLTNKTRRISLTSPAGKMELQPDLSTRSTGPDTRIGIVLRVVFFVATVFVSLRLLVWLLYAVFGAIVAGTVGLCATGLIANLLTMRIFDRTLVPGEIGVGLGDSLQAMKSKFGEPAFLIREPSSSSRQPGGQNYVYPISQVSFQLSRVNNGAPQVVSVLIFNVK